eukprot:503306-Pyramimonas_sp.AAC.1
MMRTTTYKKGRPPLHRRTKLPSGPPCWTPVSIAIRKAHTCCAYRGLPVRISADKLRARGGKSGASPSRP